MPKLEFMLGTSTVTVEWMRFLRQLLARVQQMQLPKPYLVIDNHPVHRAYAVRELYKQFHILFTPAYSSYLNSQETIWAILKRRLTLHFQHISAEIKKQSELCRQVNAVLSQMQQDYSPNKLVHAARDEYEKLLSIHEEADSNLRRHLRRRHQQR